jgi:outer membrane protein OmpA-like peptidoglycan-associated protein
MNHKILMICLVFLISCNIEKKETNKQSTNDTIDFEIQKSDTDKLLLDKKIISIDKRRKLIKLGPHINTSAAEYLPLINENGSKLYFSAMDRTGFFDFKIDYTKVKSAGGEDIFFSNLNDNLWDDARPLEKLNTNGHEVISQVFKNNDLLLTGNYIEKFGPTKNNSGLETTDLFYAKFNNKELNLYHFPEPVNTVYSEADGWMDKEQKFILFVSDRVGNIGDYQKKGWDWNSNFWGNTDVYVSLKVNDQWQPPINLGEKLNTPYAERTPWLSDDKLTLYISSNGYKKNCSDLDVYSFQRKDINSWTDWKGPFEIKDANTEFDDWGYKETKQGEAYLSCSHMLNYKPTQGGLNGDGIIRETNYRPGYEIHGQQIAALKSNLTSDIYILKKENTPIFTVSDVFFELNSDKISKNYKKKLNQLIEMLKLNNENLILINGYTDDIGNTEYNINLSQKRAEAVKNYFREQNILNEIICKGYGENNPAFENSNEKLKIKNRRVEILLE